MELIGRILDGSIPQDLKDALRRADPSGPRVSHDEKIRHLEEVPLLEDCTQKQLRSVSDISRVVEVPAGTSLTRAGQPGDEFFVILDGSAAVEKPGKKRAFLKPGDFFGEMSLLDGGPRSVTVRAATSLRVLVIDRKNFQELLREVPELTQRLLVTLSRRIRALESADRT
jgi:CRP/FNR family transcriptional regulator, cyclic AMP receptor protein